MVSQPSGSDRDFRALWEAARIERPVHYSLFTFGESDLPYFLVVDSEQKNEPVRLTRGEVKITRPMIITPENARPEFRGFFEDSELNGMVDFLLTRSAAFSHLKFDNHQGPEQVLSDSVEEVVARLNRQLDSEEEDQVAVLAAPYGFGGLAVMKYAADRVWRSAPDNIQELRERGFLPD